ncbi:MAG: phosphoribosylglycinamide formyltransferase [Solirubrobacteraceae bacterium]|nr:phosphoribosylglycinamide formyltransferase [Solirubrobacteraceae bacterium]
MTTLPRIVVLASGSGTNLQALIDTLHGREVEIVGVGSDKPGCRALGRAEEASIATATFPIGEFADRPARDAAMAAWAQEVGAQVVVLAGYMALLTPAFLDAFRERVVNVHPSLLPAFTGLEAIEQALAYGVKVFGVTVHLVDDGIDTGPILLQGAIELPEATDPEEVHRALQPIEHRLLPEAVRLLVAGGFAPDREHPRRMRRV